MEKIKIGLTGHDGFIGSRLKEKLKDHHEIDLVLFSGDLLKKEDVEAFFANNPGLDQMIHLAGAFFGDFSNLLRINVEATYNLLETAARNGVKKVIFSSSGAVYGEPIGQESFEDDPRNTNTAYGLTKKMAEDIVFYLSQNSGLRYVILRFAAVYGEGNDKGVVHNFLRDIKEKKKITVNGDGTQSRNFLHVDDACQSIEKSIFYEQSDIFNISNPVRVSLNDLIDRLKKDHQFDIEYKETDNNLKDLSLNIGKAKEKLKFEPQVTEIRI